MKKGLIAAGIAAAMVAMPIAAFAASYKAVPDSCIITDGTAAVAKTMQAVTDAVDSAASSVKHTMGR